MPTVVTDVARVESSLRVVVPLRECLESVPCADLSSGKVLAVVNDTIVGILLHSRSARMLPMALRELLMERSLPTMLRLSLVEYREKFVPDIVFPFASLMDGDFPDDMVDYFVPSMKAGAPPTVGDRGSSPGSGPSVCTATPLCKIYPFPMSALDGDKFG